jgi:chromosome segregation ATPase
LEQELSVAQEEVSGQFQLGVERDEAQRKLAEAEQTLEALRKEIDDLQKNSSAAHEEALGKINKEHGEATIALQAERDEIKLAFDALTTQSEELMKTIEVANERSGNAEKELGETKIQLHAKEKEFADLKSFYEENNASNLNEEERLKMELNEANANMQLAREEVETLKKKLTEQDERTLAAANEQHAEQIQILQATIAEARDEGTREREVAESLKQELDAKVSEVQKMKLEIEQSAEKLEEINAEKEMFMSECEKALESFDREKAKAKELKQKLKDFDQESKTKAQMKMEEHETALRAASERATFLEEELSKANAALAQASENVQQGPSAEELEREKQEQQKELHELKSRFEQELQGMNVLREQLQEERGKRAQLDARLAATLAAQQQQAATVQGASESAQKQPSPHHRFTNKKNEDYGGDDDETMLNDIEGAIISGGSYSFVPLQGKFKSLTFCPPLQSSGCLQAANMFDRFSVFLQRRPTLRVLLIGYFALLHVLLFLF